MNIAPGILMLIVGGIGLIIVALLWFLENRREKRQ